MLLSIDSEKVKEQLAKTSPAYIVTPSNLEPPIEMTYELPSAEVHGTLSGMPPDLERAHERLWALRNRIIHSGRKPLSPQELEREIDETRGRGL
jgi:hypothetical protein